MWVTALCFCYPIGDNLVSLKISVDNLLLVRNLYTGLLAIAAAVLKEYIHSP